MMTKPHLLMLTPYLPYPPVSGGRMRTYNLLKQLANDYDITLVCFGRPDEMVYDITPLGKFCDYHVVERPPSPSTKQAAIMSLTSPRAITMRLYGTDAMHQKIQALLTQKPADMIHVESFYMLQNVPQGIDTPIFLSEPAIEYRAWGKHTRVAKWYTRPGVAIEALKMRVVEPQIWAKADAVGAMSDIDKALIQKASPKARVYLAPNGVDTAFFTPNPDIAKIPNTAIYMGDYKYFPNADAVIYFATDILPLIQKSIPDFKLILLGKDPSPDILALQSDAVQVTGLVEDTRPYLQSSAVFVCPLRSGSGTRFKLLEALACGCPVVSTTIGAEGLGAVDGVNMLLRDTPQSFADGVIHLLNHPQQAHQMGVEGREWVVSKHGWGMSAQILREAYSDIMNRK
ncbi:MAG: glycosyltransferase family 4 protein [bacterium]|nr:glycosyltransferase family 4 protein [bacterium]